MMVNRKNEEKINDGDWVIYYFIMQKYYFIEQNKKIKVGCWECCKMIWYKGKNCETGYFWEKIRRVACVQSYLVSWTVFER